ncbi:MAG: DUF1684 domain-containing protein [Caldilinea sp. CFX5]|nr:DUF1684 domain-containing protein [Caldilinea sp. CFX5]
MQSSLPDYTDKLLAQRAQRAQQLLADHSWLTLAGLFWLEEGVNCLGADPNHPVVLNASGLPAAAGVIELHQGMLRLRVAPGVTMTHQGQAVTELLLRDDMSGAADYITIGPLTFLVIKRGDRYAVRLYDITNPARQRFPGLSWYPIDPALCMEAYYEPYDSPRTLAIVTGHGDITPSVNPGAVYFTVAGHECRLEAEERGDKCFFNFRDLTNRDTTYPAGRFLYTDAPVSGKVTLDFNQATNPYCAYTPYATCPLPPAGNSLPVRIEAGEKRYEG